MSAVDAALPRRVLGRHEPGPLHALCDFVPLCPRVEDRTDVEREFGALVARVQACRRCPRMEGRRRVLGPANGSPRSPVLLLAEAPGRRGAEITGVPFSGDASGRNFERLLTAAGWQRQDVFVSNAVLCNPRKPDGRNDTPRPEEVTACAEHLRDLLAVLSPQVVAPLGNVALRALARVAPHSLSLREDVAAPCVWHGRYLFPLYHPSPQVIISPTGRSLERQEDDFRRLRALVDSLEAPVWNTEIGDAGGVLS